MLEVDRSRQKSSPLTDLDREARERARGVVERADLLKTEQEEEIRMLNTVRSSRLCVSEQVLMLRSNAQTPPRCCCSSS